MVEGFPDTAKSWNGQFDCTRELTDEIIDLTRHDIKVLELIKKELHIDCKHPKKMPDRTKDG